MRVKTSTTRLPETLREELKTGNANENDDPNHYRIARHNTRVNRKEARKQERSARKQKKADFFAHSKKRPAEDELESPQRKKTRHHTQNISKPSSSTKSSSSDKQTNTAASVSTPAKIRESSSSSSKPKTQVKTRKPEKSTRTTKGSVSATSASKLPRSRVEEDEDRYIRLLEQKLGYASSSRRKTQSAEGEDGLEDLFNWADTFSISKPQLDASDIGETEYSEDDEEEEEMSDDDQEEFLSDEDGTEEGDDGNWDEEWGGVESEAEDDSESSPPQPDLPKASGAYVPPHLRKAKLDAAQPSEEVIKLTRQLKGLLNRMSEQNILSIIDGVEEIYRNNRRNDVTSTLTKLMIDGISSHSTLLDSYVVLHGAFVSSLHKLVGIEFAAHFVQETIDSYEKHYAEIPKPTSEEPSTGSSGKECSNLIVLISELYNFQVISCVLMFDIVRSLLEGSLSEFDVELLLKILRSSGQQLRQDDPLALKDIVQIVQDKVSGTDDTSSRTRFMVETLMNLKNNKVKKVAAAQSQGGDAMERMKKFLGGLSKTRTVFSHEPLRVSLEDLHSAETKGKWWLVGAAWGGNPLVDRREEFEKRAAHQQQAQNEESNLLKLARKQGMNSDIRRSIFVVLMSSEDYVDACDRLSQLNLTEVQQREIIRVLLHCCGNEKTYNPYYALICQHLCKQSHSYKITLQFCLWDFLRDLGETKVGGAELLKNSRDDTDGFDVKSISKTRMRNVAKCYAWWIARDAVSLMILKPVDFTLLKPQTTEFLRELFSWILVNSQVSNPVLTDDLSSLNLTKNRAPVEEIFIKASRTDTLAMGLVYFLTETFKPLRSQSDPASKFLTWGVNLATDTLRSGLDIVPGL